MGRRGTSLDREVMGRRGTPLGYGQERDIIG